MPKKKLKKLYLDQGLSSRKIAKLFRCDQGVVFHRLDKFGIPKRKPKEKIGILRQSHQQLADLGIKSILRLERPKGFIDRRGIVNNGDFWRLTINCKGSLWKLFNFIGPYVKHKKRLSDLEKALDNLRRRIN